MKILSTELTEISIKTGILTYAAIQSEEKIIEESSLGLETSIADFSKGLAFKGIKEEVIEEDYEMLTGKKSLYINYANQTTITFVKSDLELDIIARAYNDGVAFRYAIRKQNDSSVNFNISKELTEFKLPPTSDVYYMVHSGKNGWTYEGEYVYNKIENIPEGMLPSIPLTYKTPKGTWALLTEAHLSGEYVGSTTKMEEGTLKIAFDPTQGKEEIKTKTPFESPWRTAIIGTLETIVDNTMVENLSPPPNPEYKFEEWVKPGVSSWSWVTFYGNQENKEVHIEFIDLAVEMGWDYYILDEGWQPSSSSQGINDGTRYSGYRDWFYEVRDYANEKGIKLIAWVDSKDILQTQQRNDRLSQWSEDGIYGIKTDFFNNEKQETIAVMNNLYKEAAEYRLIVNIHGANTPTGEVRTYPNVLAREAIRGQEQGGITVEQFTMIPYIRAAIGTADVTEQIRSRDTSKTTMGFQIALSTLIENGLHSLGSQGDHYRESGAYSYYLDFPRTWENSIFLGGEFGESFSMARKASKEDNSEEWYAAAISVKASEAKIPLDFLEKDEDYFAMIYKEGPGRQEIIFETQIVNKSTVLTIPMQKGGGCGVRILEKSPSGIESVYVENNKLRLRKDDIQKIELKIYPEAERYKDFIWSSDNETIATVGSNGIVVAKEKGTAIIKYESIYNPLISETIEVTVIGEKFLLAQGWQLFNKNSTHIKFNSPTSVTITTEVGEFNPDKPSKNILGYNLPKNEDFVITAKISSGAVANYQGGFLTAFSNANISGQHVLAGRRYHTHFGNSNFGMMSRGGSQGEFYSKDNNPMQDAYVKLEKTGAVYTGYYSFDLPEANNWIKIVNGDKENITHTNLASAEDAWIGVVAAAGGSDAATNITIEDFMLNGILIPFATENTSDDVKIISANSGYEWGKSTQYTAIKESLPKHMFVTLSDGSRVNLPVNWTPNNFDPNIFDLENTEDSLVGIYTFEGEFETCLDIKNPEGVKTYFDIVIQDEEHLVAAREVRLEGDSVIAKLYDINERINSDEAKPCYILYALYNAEGKMIDSKVEKNNSVECVSIWKTLAPNKAFKVKIMLWDEDYNPIMGSYEKDFMER